MIGRVLSYDYEYVNVMLKIIIGQGNITYRGNLEYKYSVEFEILGRRYKMTKTRTVNISPLVEIRNYAEDSAKALKDAIQEDLQKISDAYNKIKEITGVEPHIEIELEQSEGIEIQQLDSQEQQVSESAESQEQVESQSSIAWEIEESEI